MVEPQHNKGKRRGPRWPELNRSRRELAEAGQVGPLWELVTTAPWSMIDPEDVFKQILKALEVSARGDPQGFAEECFARMASLTAYFVFRSHYVLNLKAEAHAAAARTRGPSDLPRDAYEVILPRVLQLQSHLAEILQARASVARQHELTRSKRIRNDRARGPGQSKGVEAAAPAPPCACSLADRRDGPPGDLERKARRGGTGDG